MRIAIQIITKDRPSELTMLLQSLLWQTYLKFDVFIYDDASGTNPQNFHFFQSACQALRCKGVNVDVVMNPKSRGISAARQAIVDYCLKNTNDAYFCRLDDDTILEPDCLQRMVDGIQKYGYDLMSGVTPPLAGQPWERDTEFVSPIINRIVLDEEGGFIVNTDDCGHRYTNNKVLPCHHFRSYCVYKREVHEKVNYEKILTPCGFREEEFFSIRMLLAGFRLGVDTGAIAWHLCAPSGGDRRQEYSKMANENQRLLNIFVREKFKEHGDFISKYNKNVLFLLEDPHKFDSLNKNNNLIFNREV